MYMIVHEQHEHPQTVRVRDHNQPCAPGAAGTMTVQGAFQRVILPLNNVVGDDCEDGVGSKS
jgi:hypothetical protein